MQLAVDPEKKSAGVAQLADGPGNRSRQVAKLATDLEKRSRQFVQLAADLEKRSQHFRATCRGPRKTLAFRGGGRGSKPANVLSESSQTQNIYEKYLFQEKKII